MVSPGIRVTEAAQIGSPTIPIQDSRTIIGLLGGTAENGAPAVGVPTLVRNRNEAAVFGDSGTIAEAIEAIYNHVQCPIVVVRYDDTIAGADDLKAEIEAKWDIMATAESQAGVAPNIIISNNFPDVETAQDTPALTASPYVTKMNSVAELVRAVAIYGAPAIKKVTDYKTWLGVNEGARMATVFPRVLPAGVGAAPAYGNVKDPAPYVAGAIARMDVQYGYWNNPSLEPLAGVGGVYPSVSFKLDDPNSDGIDLAGANSMAVVRSNGFRIFGSRFNISNTDLYKFINVRRISDDIVEFLNLAVATAISRNIVSTFFDDVTSSVNDKMSQLITRGAIISGRCTPDRVQNTVTNLANGITYFNIVFTPTIPAQQINFSIAVSTGDLALI